MPAREHLVIAPQSAVEQHHVRIFQTLGERIRHPSAARNKDQSAVVMAYCDSDRLFAFYDQRCHGYVFEVERNFAWNREQFNLKAAGQTIWQCSFLSRLI